MDQRKVILPPMATISQTLYSAPLAEAEIIRAVHGEFKRLGLAETIRPNQTIAIGAGSRGVASIHLIIKTLVEAVKAVGANPFVFPAMGSHGGATGEGQTRMLASLGITEEYIRCPIKSSLEVVELGQTEEGLPVYLDRFASEADGILIANRVKPHTSFRGEVESGLLKMLAIGAGKQAQAMAIHPYGFPVLAHLLTQVAQVILQKAPVLAGFAVLEDGYHKASRIVGIAPADFLAKEAELLREVRQQMSKLPIDDLDILIVERMGKNISGAGMDTNVTGRMRVPEMAYGFVTPRIKVVIVLDLTEESYGNAVGIGSADLTVRRLVNKINFDYTYTNGLTANDPLHTMLPITLETDRKAIEAAMVYLLPPMSASELKVIRIRDTLTLDKMQVSGAVWQHIHSRVGVSLESQFSEVQFDTDGILL